MCSAAKKVFDAIKNVLKKIWDVIRKYIVYIVIICAIFWPFILPMLLAYLPAGLAVMLPTAGVWATTALSWQALAWRAIAGLAIGFLIDKDTTSKIVGKVADVAKDVAGAVGEIAGGAIEGVTSGLFSGNLGLWLVGGVVAWVILTRDSDDQQVSTSPA